ncbi:MAG: flagellin-like protein [Magnetovibrio sp.]|nr:flagellin-like protein [Magnetovibrio sp.]
MSDVTLSASVRSSLLSLQDTSKLVQQTQSRLSTGLRVASAIDDPVSFFQAKGLNDRASDLNQKKDGIDQGVSGVTAALDAVESVENIVQQLKGLANSMKSATGTQFSDLITQFNSLRTQIGSLVADASYQGTNLVNNTAQSLSVEFSDNTASLLTVTAANLDETGLSLGGVDNCQSNSSTFMINFSANASESLTAGSSLTFTYKGTDTTFSSGSFASFDYGTATVQMNVATGDSLVLTQGTVYSATIATNTERATGTYFAVGENLATAIEANYSAGSTLSITTGSSIKFTYQGPDTTFTTGDDLTTLHYGTASLVMDVVSGAAVSLTQGAVFTIAIQTAGAGSATVGTGVLSIAEFKNTAQSVVENDLTYRTQSALSSEGVFTTWASEGDSTALNSAITQMDGALNTLRAQASSLGSNVALLQTRLDFTSQYVNTLEEGASKLTLADINEEGANLLALQTRQQLGITSLSFAGQAEQSILGLF